jgi:hypothetical protein
MPKAPVPAARAVDPAIIAVRMGAFDGDPGIRPTFRQYVAYAAPWEPIPDDGLPRYDEARPPSNPHFSAVSMPTASTYPVRLAHPPPRRRRSGMGKRRRGRR